MTLSRSATVTPSPPAQPAAVASLPQTGWAARRWRIGVLRWTVAAFLVVLGALMAVAPHQFGVGLSSFLGEALNGWGFLFLGAGLGLVGAGGFAPRGQWAMLAHIAASLPLLILATSSARIGGWLGLINYAGLAMAVAVAPLLARRGAAGSLPAYDLFGLILAANAVVSGLTLLVSQSFPGVVRLGLPLPVLVAIGAAMASGGLLLLVASLRPTTPAWLDWSGRLLIATGMFGIAFPSVVTRTLPAILYYGGFGLVLLLAPLLQPRLARVDLASLRVRLALALAVFTALPLLLAVALLTDREEDAIIARALTRYQALASALAGQVETSLALHRAALTALAVRPDLIALPAAEQQRILAAAQAAYPEIEYFATHTADGMQIARGDGRPLVTSGSVPGFEEARRTNAPALGVRLSPVLGQPVVTLGQPILDSQGRFVGFLSAALQIDRVADDLARAGGVTNGTITLVDRDGRLMLTTDPAGPAFGTDLSTTTPVAQIQSDATAGAVLHGPPADARIAGYAPVADVDWGIIVEQPTATILASLRSSRELAFGLLLLTMGLMAALGWWVAGRVAAPLGALADAAGWFEAGDATPALPHSTVTEIRQLAGAFGTMRDRLAERSAAERAARLAAELAAERTAHLQTVTAALGATLTPAEVADTILQQGLAAVGAVAGGVGLLSADQAFMETAATKGFPAAALEDWRRYPLTAVTPITDAVRSRVPVLVESLAQSAARYPMLATPPARSNHGAWAALPLLVDGRAIGALGFSFATPRTFTTEDLGLMVALANQCAQALERARLFDAEHQARVRQAFLADASAALVGLLAVPATAEALARVAIPTLGDYSVVYLSDDGQRFQRAATAHVDSAQAALIYGFSAAPFDITSPHSQVARALVARQPVVKHNVDDAWLVSIAPDTDHLRLLRALAPTAIITAPLFARGSALGVRPTIAVSAASGRRFRDDDVMLAGELANRAALVLDNARLYQTAIADRAQVEAALGETEAAVRARDAFLSIAAHELKTPVAGLKGSAQLLLRRQQRGDLDPARLARTLDSLNAAADRLVHLVDDLLDVARLQTGQLALDVRPLELTDFLTEAVERASEQLDDDHQMSVSLPERRVPIVADAARLDQVLTNLLENAVKYSPVGGDVVVALQSDDGGATISVHDHGMGWPADEVEVIFAPFARATNATSSHLPGMGLGLYISRNIVERHGGRIWAESPGEGQGATFRVWLPPIPTVAEGTPDAQ